jgi:hypothetical protein
MKARPGRPRIALGHIRMRGPRTSLAGGHRVRLVLGNKRGNGSRKALASIA